jgi:adenylate cyclase
VTNIYEHNPVAGPLSSAQKEDASRQNNARGGLSLQKLFLLFSVITILITAIVIFVPFNSTARENIDNLARKVNAETVLRVATEVSSLLQSAESVQDSLYQMFVSSPELMSNIYRREGIFFSILKSNPSFSWISFGMPNGDFFGVQRADPTNYRIVDSRHSQRGRDLRNTEKYLSANG